MTDSKDLQTRLASLSPAKRALLEFKLQQSRGGCAANLTISRRADNGLAPLSFAQQRLWFLGQLEPESCVYNEKSAIRLDGALNLQALHGAINAIVARHEVLRTTYTMADGGEPLQRIGAAKVIDLPLFDVSEIAEHRRDYEVQRIGAELREKPFDLGNDWPLRLALIKLAPSYHVLIEVKHHIASDGWSSSIFTRELAALYNCLSQGLPSPLPELPIQYADYAVWQREWLQGAVLEKQLAFWKAQLKDVPVLDLPTDRPRQPTSGNSGAKRSLKLPQTLIDRLRSLSKREGTTLFMTLLAAFQVLLHRYTGQDDIAVGSPIAGRTRKETEGLIGFFVNTLVLRSKLSSNPSFSELLARVRETALQAYEHQDLPFEKLVEELNPDRHQSQTPLFQVMFAVQNTPRSNLDLSGLKVSPVEIESSTAKFDISVACVERDGEMNLRIEYRTDLFEAATIERMLGHFQNLLEGIISNPEQRISELPLLSEAERHQLLVEWNNTKREYPSDKCIHQLFEEQVAKTPDAMALIFEDQQLTYHELNSRVNQLAHYLRKLGVGPNVLVGICVERSIEMVVGLLGVLKAGGAYVPLDPTYPRERLLFMLEDSQVRVLITQEEYLSNLEYCTIVCLDRDWPVIANENGNNPQIQNGTGDLAYVIYTSGSTGKPKGTLISHRNVARLFDATEAWFHFDASDVWTLFHSYAFDFSVWEIWGAILYGGKLIIVTDETRRSPQEFTELLIEHHVTVLNQTPSAFRQLMSHLMDSKNRNRLDLRFVIFGGEALELQSLKSWFECYGDENPQVINMYGITETTVHVTYRPINRVDIDAKAGSVIGKPIPDLEVYLLDKHSALVPIGVTGEIYVGGAGVAKGYLGRDELTAERFVTHPFSDNPQTKIYRSGDLARWLPSGDLEYLGRVDDQVKIRGFRVELGEIESVLAQHPAIQQAVVLAREDTPGDKRLVAYVVAALGAIPLASDLRKLLQQRLPEYMVPSTIISLRSLPLTANGKLDRKALPVPDQSRPELGENYFVPRTPVEEILANIWASVLKLDKVGIHENFFQLGGHSLLATQVISRVIGAFSIGLPVRRLFETPTIAGLAASIDASLAAKSDTQSIPPIVPRAQTGDAPLSFAQQRLWFLDRLDPDNTTYNVPAVLRLTGELDARALEQSFNEIVRRHEVLRTVLITVNGEPAQTLLSPSPFALTCTDISDRPENEREKMLPGLVREEADKPFDLSRGPLLRAKLLRLAPKDHVLCLNMHHIVSDGWSMGVLFRELSDLYQSYVTGAPISLPELPIQYADYTVWQRQWLQGEELDRQLSYWRKQLDGLFPLQLPTDRPRPAVQTYRGARATFELCAPLFKALKALSQQQGVTLFMMLLASFQLLLSRYCGQSDIAVGSPIAGRTRQEIERLIGFFVNTLVLRADLSANPTFPAFLRQVRETTLDAYTHQDLPFEKLVEELHPERSLSHSPLFQVMFAFQNNADRPLQFEGLTIQPFRTASDVAKFDLMLNLSEKDGTLGGSLNYNTDLFNASTIERMLGHFRNLLEGIVANPEQRINALPLLSEAERHQLLVEWNDTKRDYPKDKCIHQLFEEQVERTPDAVAVKFEDQQLTYRELNQRANQLAHYLIAQGAYAETRVAICLERSIELAIGFLAVLKAGGVYVPLDPTYPRERLMLMVQDSQAPFIVSVRSLASQISSQEAQLIFLDTARPQLDRQDHTNPRSTIASHNPAYVLYTSGSTGIPKGVVMGHGALGNLVSWQVDNLTEPLPARTLQFASLGFDVSIQEMLATWCTGGSLILINDELRRDGLGLLRYLEEQSIERVFLPYVALQHIADAAKYENCYPQNLREIITAGEQLRLTDSLRSFLSQLGNCCLRNQYGPTESHVVTEFALNPPSNHWPDVPPIGHPIANTQIYILDPDLNPVSIGVSGELHISGVGLARGYLNRPELTSEKFIDHSFNGEPTRRLYKTGDLARYLPDGNIEFIGRIDNQVKIRGYRIELGEIEATLGQLPSIRESVVLAREDSPGDRRLVAYVVSAPGCARSVNELRDLLQQKLPEYMVPSAFVYLEEMPLSPNGKLDRKALPAPDQSRFEMDENYFVPRTPVEEILATIWAGILKLDKVGIHDNFFQLGGHSLLATQVISRINDTFAIDLLVRRLFETPTIAGLAASIDASLAAKNDLQRIPPIVARAQTGDAPLSFAQQRLWFLDRLEPNSTTYNVPAAFRIEGELNVHALEQSLTELIKRHEALRTIFPAINGRPVQTILPPSTISLLLTDLSDRSQSDREQMLQSLLQQDAEQPFDLERGPLLRSQLIRLASREHVLLLSMHHIVSDGWSQGVLYRELSDLYQAYDCGQPSILSELAVQYADYSVWQRQWLQGEELDRQLSYWRKELQDVSTLQLPTDRPRPAVQTYRGASHAFTLSAELTQAIKALCEQQGVTQFMALLAALNILLCRYSGQTDIAVGSPIAGRTRQEIEGLIGFFVNTLVMRSDLSSDPTVMTLLRQVCETTLEAYSHQDLPFEKLVEELQPERNMGHTPLFQVMFAFQNTSHDSIKLGQATVETLRASSHTAKFDLTLTMSVRDGELRGSLNYNTDLFDAPTIERMLGHFRILLEGIIANPERRISELPLLSEGEKRQLLFEWNDTQKEYPRDKCIHELFEEQVERTPDAVALVFEDQQLTYRELNERANQLAHHLRKFGVGTDVLVGICVERSIELIVGLLGILKAGGAYVPLDPSYPKERLAFMLRDSAAQVLITKQALVDHFPDCSAKMIFLDADWQKIDQDSDCNVARNTTPDHLAYVIYTSGSTGEPKGVAVSHQAVSRLVMNADYVQVSSADVMAQGSNVSFDAATFEIWGALLNGARLVLIAKDILLSPPALFSAIERHGITTLFLTTALFNQMAEQIPKALGKIRNLLFGGEVADPRRVKELLRTGSPSRLLHVYGPTETTTFASWYMVNSVSEDATSIPIGKPIANTEIYILDSHLDPVPIGVAGELHIGGVGLARGYLNRPELTAEKFIANPFSNDPLARLYKTGDIARYLPDNNIEFLGRIDNQVKIRGFRIELGEVEATLGRHPAIREAIVMAGEDNSRDKRLIAYVLSNRQSGLTSAELRRYLRETLPEYMVPTGFVLLEAFPLTPNGKVDRNALRATNSIEHAHFDNDVAPRTPIEAVLMEIWCEILGVEQIGVDDNFFELGGHSLLGIRLVDKICRQCQADVPLRVLFECPTVKSMSARISKVKVDAANNRRATSSHSYLFELKPGKGCQPVFFLPGGFGGDYEFLVYARLVHYAGDDYGFYGLRARSADGVENAHVSVEEMAVDYLREIQALQPNGPYFLVGNCIGGVVAYEIARQLEAAGQQVALLVMMDTVRPLLRSYLRYRANRVKRRMNARFSLGSGYFGLRDNYYVARSVYHSRRLWQLPWSKKLPYLIRKTGVAIGESPNLFSSLAPIELDDGRDGVREGYVDTLRRYRPRPYRGRVVMLNNSNVGSGDPTLGWENLVLGGIEVQTIPGNHEAYIRQYVRVAGEKLRGCLEKAAVENRSAMSQTEPTADSVAAQKCGTGLETVIE